jgi:hypothetical protein
MDESSRVFSFYFPLIDPGPYYIGIQCTMTHIQADWLEHTYQKYDPTTQDMQYKSQFNRTLYGGHNGEFIQHMYGYRYVAIYIPMYSSYMKPSRINENKLPYCGRIQTNKKQVELRYRSKYSNSDREFELDDDVDVDVDVNVDRQLDSAAYGRWLRVRTLPSDFNFFVHDPVHISEHPFVHMDLYSSSIHYVHTNILPDEFQNINMHNNMSLNTIIDTYRWRWFPFACFINYTYIWKDLFVPSGPYRWLSLIGDSNTRYLYEQICTALNAKHLPHTYTRTETTACINQQQTFIITRNILTPKRFQNYVQTCQNSQFNLRYNSARTDDENITYKNKNVKTLQEQCIEHLFYSFVKCDKIISPDLLSLSQPDFTYISLGSHSQLLSNISLLSMLQGIFKNNNNFNSFTSGTQFLFVSTTAVHMNRIPQIFYNNALSRNNERIKYQNLIWKTITKQIYKNKLLFNSFTNQYTTDNESDRHRNRNRQSDTHTDSDCCCSQCSNTVHNNMYKCTDTGTHTDANTSACLLCSTCSHYPWFDIYSVTNSIGQLLSRDALHFQSNVYIELSKMLLSQLLSNICVKKIQTNRQTHIDTNTNTSTDNR